MDNGKDIKEIITEIDADNVNLSFQSNNLQHLNLHLHTSSLLMHIYLHLQDGRINYDEFTAMMRKGNPEGAANPKKRRNTVFAS